MGNKESLWDSKTTNESQWGLKVEDLGWIYLFIFFFFLSLVSTYKSSLFLEKKCHCRVTSTDAFSLPYVNGIQKRKSE